MALQLILYCHNMIELQRMAQVMSDRQSYSATKSVRDYSRFHALWGKVGLGKLRVEHWQPRPWRPFRGISTVQHPGLFYRVQVGATLFPGHGFSRVLGWASKTGYAEGYLEPPLPQES